MIETERLRLRNWRAGDDELLHIHCNTAAVMRWLGGAQPREKMTEVTERLTRLQEERGHTFWAVERKSDQAFLGFCLMRRLGMIRREDLDYIDPDWPEEMNPTIVYVLEASEWRK